MSNSVHFAPGTVGGGGPPLGGGDTAEGGTNLAGGLDTAAASTTNPAVTLWDEMVALDSLPDLSFAKALAVKYADTPWEDVVAPFVAPYPDDPAALKNSICHAPAAKYILAVNAAGSVQLVYGLRFCHDIAGSGQRVLGLAGERSVIAGVERPPDLVTLAGNLPGQNAHFGTNDPIRAATVEDIVAALDADPAKLLMDPLAADPDNDEVNPEIVARRALVIHPKIGLLFLQPLPPSEALRLVLKIQQAVPAALQGSLAPLLNFARVAVTSTVAGGDVSALRSDWQRQDHGLTTNLIVWYYELVGQVVIRYVPSKAPVLADNLSRSTIDTSDDKLGQALQQLANNTSVMAERKSTGYKPHELDLLFRLCRVPLLLDRERDITDLPLFWIEFHKYRGKINDARGYIERFYQEHSTLGGLDEVLFGHQFVQDMMNHDLAGRDRMTEFKHRFRGFSPFSIGPIDFNFTAGETQRQELLRYENAKLKLEETLAFSKKNDQIMQQLISLPKNLLEFHHFMDHMHRICVTFFGDQFLPARHFERIANTCLKRQYFSRYQKINWWALLWRTHMALRQYFVDGEDDLFDQIFSDLKRYNIPGAELLPPEMLPKAPPGAVVTDNISAGASVISDISDSTGGSSTNTKPKFDGSQVFANEIAYAYQKIPNFRTGNVFPGGEMDKLLGNDFRSCVQGRQPCFKFFIMNACDNPSCRRSHKLKHAVPQGIINQIKTRFRAGIDRHVSTAAGAGGAGGGGGGGGGDGSGRGGGNGGGGGGNRPPGWNHWQAKKQRTDDDNRSTAATATSSTNTTNSSSGDASGVASQT